MMTKHVTYKIKERILLGLQDIEKLEDNWDSYGGIAPTHDTIELAKEFIGKFPERYQPEVAPDPSGSIELSWAWNGLFTLELYINANDVKKPTQQYVSSLQLLQHLLNNTKDLDRDCADVVENNFWDLLA